MNDTATSNDNSFVLDVYEYLKNTQLQIYQ